MGLSDYEYDGAVRIRVDTDQSPPTVEVRIKEALIGPASLTATSFYRLTDEVRVAVRRKLGSDREDRVVAALLVAYATALDTPIEEVLCGLRASAFRNLAEMERELVVGIV